MFIYREVDIISDPITHNLNKKYFFCGSVNISRGIFIFDSETSFPKQHIV